jgi:TRAP-type C4-dicarboxylate transport system permease small subunit
MVGRNRELMRMRATIKSAALGLDRLSAGLNQMALWGAVFAVLIMLFAAGWQVVARYVLAQPPIWTEELARFSMVWAGVLGGSCAFRANSDPSLFPEMRDYSGPIGKALTVIRAVGAFAFIAPVLWFSIFGLNLDPARGYVGRLAGRSAETMPLPMTVFGIAIPIAFGLILVHILADLSMRLTHSGHSAAPSESTP